MANPLITIVYVTLIMCQKINLVISCFFLRPTNTLKQPALLHFINSGLRNLLRSYSEYL
jgi:hypothetical protein